MWRVGFYVDEFGESTKEGYITNISKLKGLFSNTADNAEWYDNAYRKLRGK